MRRIEDQTFLLLLIAATLAFAWIILPFYGAVLWAIVGAVIFAPLNRQLLRSMREWPSLAALIAVLFIIAMVLLPLALIATSLVQEASNLYSEVQAGKYDFSGYIQRILDILPSWAVGLLDRLNLNLRENLASGVVKGGQVLAPQALNVGINTFDFVVELGIMLYLLFFLLRDGKELAQRVKAALPLRADQKAALFGRFVDVVQATVKGGILVAIAQGALGGLAFWFLGIHAPLLWAVLMSFLSLLPAIGSGLVWGPLAIYLLASGSVWEGVGLILYGVLVVGLVDNLLRPFLIGKETRLPDYVVLLSTLGGIEVFGLNGFLIGPLIAAIFMVTWEIFSVSRQPGQEGLGDA